MYILNKFSLIILTRCNLRCRLCCEYVPQNKPFPDMTPEEEAQILDAIFHVADHITTLHLTGGGEPFLHPQLAELVENAMAYSDRFDTLMLFTNCTIPISPRLMETLERHRDKLLVQVSQYGKMPDREAAILEALTSHGIRCKTVNYSGKHQDFGGWVDFGPWDLQNQESAVLKHRFASCAVSRDMCGNWRTRNGKVHWCSRSQRGMELGLIPDNSDDYVDLFCDSTREEKQKKFTEIANMKFISACNHCSGDQGTEDQSLRFAAAEQIGEKYERTC